MNSSPSIAMRSAMSAFPTGVVLVAAEVQGGPIGLLVNSFTSVSLEPPLVSISISRTSETLRRLRQLSRWGISVLGEQHASEFSDLSRPAANRFDRVNTNALPDGSIFLPDANATMVVSPEAGVDAGDHVIMLLSVIEVDREATSKPLVFYGSSLRRLCA